MFSSNLTRSVQVWVRTPNSCFCAVIITLFADCILSRSQLSQPYKIAPLTRHLLGGGGALNAPTFSNELRQTSGSCHKLNGPSSDKISEKSNRKFWSYWHFSDVTTRDFGPKSGYCLRVHKRQTIEWKRIQTQVRRKMTSSTRWLSRIFDISWFWPPKFQKHLFCFWMNKNDHKIKNLENFQKTVLGIC